MRVGGIRVNGRSSAAGCTAGKDSVDQMNCSDMFEHTRERRGSSACTAAGDLLAPTISRNTRALTRRHLTNAMTLNYSTPLLLRTDCMAPTIRIY